VSADAGTGGPEHTIQPGVDDNLARRRSPFVGRAFELRQLYGAFEATVSGDGALVMLAGEPGIGKTALCQQLARFVGTRSGLALVGHSYPEGSAGLPYQPFVEAFESYARQCGDAEALRADLGASASEIARIVPALRNLLQVELAAPENPEDDRFRLLSAVLDFLRGVGTRHPLLLVLEDVHDADRGTLDLLIYLARHLAGTPILLVATYRDVEVDRAHPLAAALAELRRVSQFERIHLGELSVDEVRQLLASSSQQSIPRPLAEAVHRRSGGNALFAHELLRFLLSEHLVEQRDGALRGVGSESLAGHMPEGLRDVVGKRLSRLSSAANLALSVASVIGREFQLDVLRRVQSGSEEELECALEEAVGAALVEEHSVVGTTITYRFSHAFFQQTLYAEVMAPRRIRLHQQVARALEEVFSNAGRLEEHATELAEHYAFSSDPLDLGKAIHYGELAATRASDVFAYGEAASQLERTLVVLALADPENNSKRCDLLLALGQALWPAGETERVIAHVAPDALALAEKQGDRGRAFRACRLALDCLQAQGASSVMLRSADNEYLRWAELAHRYAIPDSAERLYADLALAFATSSDPRRRQEAHALQSQGLALARQLGDAEALFRSVFGLLLTSSPQHWGECLRLAEEAISWPRQAVSAQTLGLFLWCAGTFQLAEGQRTRAEELWGEVAALAQRTHVVSVTLMVPERDAFLAIMDGHLEEALVQWRQYVGRADELGASLRGRMLGLQILLSLVGYLGRTEVWLTASEEFVRMGGFRSAPRAAACLVQLGRLEEARALVGPMLDEIAVLQGDDEALIPQLVNFLEAAVAVGHRGAARALMARLDCVAHLSSGAAFKTCIARHLGDAAVLVGDRTAARAYYAQALEVAGKIRFRPELALTHLRLAEMLFEETDRAARSEALMHLDTATPELRDMKMRPALQRALALKDTYQAAGAHMSARSPATDGLTAREREIAGLMADRLSNREIAERLVITEGTVEVHVKRILSKLGFGSRRQMTAWVAQERAEAAGPDRYV
jgi:DNA-binding CsgD family transcriptional regulator